jgi:hypothetical protein
MKKIVEVIVQLIGLQWLKLIIIGKINTISTSKIKKIIAIKKKWREKGIRLGDWGSNPHSNGEFFSRSNWDFLAKKIDTVIIKLVIIMNINLMYLIIFIIYIKN